MHRSEAVEILVRRLGLNAGRTAALGQRLAEAGLLPRAVGRNVPSLCSRELARLLLVVIVDDGLGSAAAQTLTFENLQTESGITLGSVMEAVIRGDVEIIGDAAFQIGAQPAAMLQGIYFGAALNTNGATRITHVPNVVMRAIAFEFQGKTSGESNELIYQTTKTELQKARSRQAKLEGELREIEKQLAAKPFDEHDPSHVELRDRGRELRDELSSIERRLPELESTFSALTVARKAEARTLIAPARASLDRLAAALAAVAAAANEAEQHRLAIHQAGGTPWKRIPTEVLAVPGARKLVEKATVELQGTVK